ncbi:MAG: hypothetical protein PUB01_00085 [Desulfovibrionaceae bacterium]|nr:hypothetical protein [Desulfovibrionaceae bacterium]
MSDQAVLRTNPHVTPEESVLQSHQPQPCMRKEVAVHLLSRTKAAG